MKANIPTSPPQFVELIPVTSSDANGQTGSAGGAPRCPTAEAIIILQEPKSNADREVVILQPREFCIFPGFYQNLSVYTDAKVMLRHYGLNLPHNIGYEGGFVEPFILKKVKHNPFSKGVYFYYEKEDGDADVFRMSDTLTIALQQRRHDDRFKVVFLFENRAGDQQFFEADEYNRLTPIEPQRMLTATDVFVEMDQNVNKLEHFNKFVNALASNLNCTRNHDARMAHIRFYVKQLSFNPDFENEHFPVDDRLAVVFVMAALEREGCTLNHGEKIDLLMAVKEQYPYYAITYFKGSLSNLGPYEGVEKMYPALYKKELQSFSTLRREFKVKGLMDQFKKAFCTVHGMERIKNFYNQIGLLPSEILSKEETITQFFEYFNEGVSMNFIRWQLDKRYLS